MTARQFIAPTARLALDMVLEALGPDAVILQNRKVAGGVAVTAMRGADLDGLQAPAPRIASRRADADSVAASGFGDWEAPMSTVNFERFANERNTRRQRKGDTHAPIVRATVGAGVNARTADVSAATPRAEAASVLSSPASLSNSRPPTRAAQTSADARSEQASPSSGIFRRDRDETAHELMQMAGELRQMRSFISEQFSALSWVDGVRRTPAQAHLLRRMLDAGFSTKLARAMIGHLPAELDSAAADGWLSDRLAANLAVSRWQDGLLDGGGVFALVGPTGVGKTTSVAKIAARFALAHGVESVGLITADAYRVGAQDQLRRFGSMIGITVHAAQDAQGLAGLLKLLARKRLVLIDTAGLGQRDPRVADLLTAVTRGAVQRLLVLSAAAQAESLQESIAAYHGPACAGVLLTKIDEACRLGGALDSLIRARMTLVAIGNGQRVPEDWQEPDARALIGQALASGADEGQGLSEFELTMLMRRADPAQSAIPDNSGAH